ncbi:Hypothetical predicted protein, partial [Paramuricea clavata]
MDVHSIGSLDRRDPMVLAYLDGHGILKVAEEEVYNPYQVAPVRPGGLLTNEEFQEKKKKGPLSTKEEENLYQVKPVRPGGRLTAQQLQSVWDGHMKCADMLKHVLRMILPNTILAGTNVEHNFDVRRIPHFWRRVGRPEYWPEDVAWQSPSTTARKEEVYNPYQVAPVRPGGLLTNEEFQEVRAGNWTCGTMRSHVLRMILPNTILAGTPGLKANVLPAVEPIFQEFVEEIEQQEVQDGTPVLKTHIQDAVVHIVQEYLRGIELREEEPEEEVYNPYQVAPVRPGGLLTNEEFQEVRAGNWTCGTMRNHVLRMILPNTILAGTPGLKANVLPAVEPIFQEFVEEIEQQEVQDGTPVLKTHIQDAVVHIVQEYLRGIELREEEPEEEVYNPYQVAPVRPGGLLTNEEFQEVRAGNWTCGTMRSHVLRMILPNTILAGTPGLNTRVRPAIEPLFRRFTEEIEQQEVEDDTPGLKDRIRTAIAEIVNEFLEEDENDIVLDELFSHLSKTQLNKQLWLPAVLFVALSFYLEEKKDLYQQKVRRYGLSQRDPMILIYLDGHGVLKVADTPGLKDRIRTAIAEMVKEFLEEDENDIVLDTPGLKDRIRTAIAEMVKEFLEEDENDIVLGTPGLKDRIQPAIAEIVKAFLEEDENDIVLDTPGLKDRIRTAIAEMVKEFLEEDENDIVL